MGRNRCILPIAFLSEFFIIKTNLLYNVCWTQCARARCSYFALMMTISENIFEIKHGIMKKVSYTFLHKINLEYLR